MSSLKTQTHTLKPFWGCDMATLQENSQQLLEYLQMVDNGVQSIKVVAEEKGDDLTDVPFTQFADRIRTWEGEKATLNAPKIVFYGNESQINVIDNSNGVFAEKYKLYVNGEEKAIVDSKRIYTSYYNIAGNDEIMVCAIGKNFHNSPLSNSITWSDYKDGTEGLVYDGYVCRGIGTSEEKNIYVSSTNPNDGTVIYATGIDSFKGVGGLTINLPSTISVVSQNSFENCYNMRIVFTSSNLDFGYSGYYGKCFLNARNMVLDFSKMDTVPIFHTSDNFNGFGGWIVVRDDKYDEWINTTNIVNASMFIIKLSDFEKQGETV